MASNTGFSGGIADFGRRLAQELRTAVGSAAKAHKSDRGSQTLPEGSFEDAVAAMSSLSQTVSPEQLRVMLRRGCRSLGPDDEWRVMPKVAGLPDSLSLGWVHSPDNLDQSFSLGVFIDKTHFAQIALCDSHARVFLGDESDLDTAKMLPVFMLSKEGNVTFPDSKRLGHADTAAGTEALNLSQGSVVGQDEGENMFWLASWLTYNDRFTLEQLRPQLPESMRYDLEYRDAVSIAFFYAYLLPRLSGNLTGFGAGNIFRRLRREAPMGAIRRSVRDSLQAQAAGMRTSGLEDYFADLMKEAKALEPIPGLEAVHGAEPMHLYASTYSGAYMFSWDSGMDLATALRALRIEGNLNRFAAASAWLERNSRMGLYPIEDTVTRVEAAQLDQALLNNPAISVLQMEEELPRDFDPLGADGREAVILLLDRAQHTAAQLREESTDPLSSGEDEPGSVEGAGGSEWVYRQALSRLLRSMRLPFRFDAEFRSNLSQGQVAIAFTSAGHTMMPSSRFDSSQHGWVDLSEADRRAMSADYNLRVGLMMAALAFGADSSVSQVSLHIDSLGLEEAQAQQDSAIAQMMTQALSAFERARSGSAAVTGSKGDPKDGDIHGDPHTMIANEQPTAPGQHNEAVTAEQVQAEAETEPAPATTEESSNSVPQLDTSDEQSVNQEFASLMQGLDLDSMAFAAPSAPDSAAGSADQAAGVGDEDEDTTASNALSMFTHNPTVRNLVTVTFDRVEFLSQLFQYGLSRPKEFYQTFDARMKEGEDGGLEPVEAGFDMRDERFAPRGSQDEPELEDLDLSPQQAEVVGADHITGLSIQRADLLERSMADFRRLSESDQLSSATKARQVMDLVNRIGDPELGQLAPQITSALIDDKALPDLDFTLAAQLDKNRIKARDMLFSGDVSGAIEFEQEAVEKVDALFAGNPDQHNVPRYFNSYAERVVYNRLFATPGEHTLLIPDNLFYAHIELADILTQFKQDSLALKHLNTMVAYAPAYPLSHLKLAVQLSLNEDWTGARAATLNALQVALDRSDAAFAYYRFAYAAWMRDEFAVAAAAYIMAEHISPGRIKSLQTELEELTARADSQCIPVPKDYDDARLVLHEQGLPVWPHTKVSTIVRQAARVLVDAGQFVPARTLSVAAARMNDEESDGLDMVEVQFLQSLNA